MGKKMEPGSSDVVVKLHGDDKIADITRYGDWRPDKDGRYLVPGRLSGSDYSGSLVERSNYNVFSDKFKDGHDNWWTSVIGGHGTYAIVISMDDVPDEVSDEVAEFLNGLDDYPLADEDDHSNLEMEAQNEAWENWARRDFIKEIEKWFKVEFDNDPKSELLYEVFHEACDSANEYWVNESGDSMYINIERIVKKGVSKEDVKQLVDSSKE